MLAALLLSHLHVLAIRFVVHAGIIHSKFCFCHWARFGRCTKAFSQKNIASAFLTWNHLIHWQPGLTLPTGVAPSLGTSLCSRGALLVELWMGEEARVAIMSWDGNLKFQSISQYINLCPKPEGNCYCRSLEVGELMKMSVCLSVCLSACLPACPLCLSAYISIDKQTYWYPCAVLHIAQVT